MSRFDRLTTLMERFSLNVHPAAVRDATLVVVAGPDGAPARVRFGPQANLDDMPVHSVLVSAEVDWGGAANPLVAALPDLVELDVTHDRETSGLILLMQSELLGQRCGSGSVVNRLGEVLIVRLLRAQIEAGTTRTGLLAGLSDPRLSRAIVAMHDTPGRDWRNDDLAQIAGLSLSRFAGMFLDVVGETPAAYLRRWRLTLARQDVLRGDRVDSIARRYGYHSPEGFARAFKKHYGETPVSVRPRPAA
jgi:AraC-like DNA-binding protein